MHPGRHYVHIHAIMHCCSSKTEEGKLSLSSPPPSFSLQLRLSLFTRLADGYVFVTSQSVSFPLLLLPLLLPLLLQWTDVAFSLSEMPKMPQVI